MSSQSTSDATFHDAYNALNPEQKQAVDAIEGPVMVVAGPGTGKTQILTLRIANILKQTHVTPENILALTFTNSGVHAMRSRLRSYIKDDAYRVGIYTFHSFAEHVLHEYREYFPAHEFATVITEVEKAKIIETILAQHDFTEVVSTYDRFSSLRQIMGAIDDIKQEGLSPEVFEAAIPTWEATQMEAEEMFYKRATGVHKAGDIKPTEVTKVQKRVRKAHEIATVFTQYQRMLKEKNLYDFSDMILTLLTELETNDALRLDLQEQYQYLLIDEHQDTNEGQNKLIEQLTNAEHLNGRPNLFTVGDEKQSIYRFQGASAATFAHFKAQYQAVEQIELTQNYRSSEPILTVAHDLITHSLPDAQALSSITPQAPAVAVREFSDYKFELLFVTKDIKDKIAAGVSPEEIAIIYRSNKHLLEIKQLLQQSDIPYQVRSRDTLLDDPGIQMLINLITVLHNPHDDHSFGKLLFADFLALDALAVAETLRAYQQAKRDTTSPESLHAYLKTTDQYTEVLAMLAQLKKFAANHHFAETFKEILHHSGYLRNLLQKPDSRSGLRKVETLFNECKRQADAPATYGIGDFVDFVNASASYNLNIEVVAAGVGSGVQCMTAHGAKGLEFTHVYLINAVRSAWEKSRGFAPIALPLDRYQGTLDDERRLFYVAVTRAKTHLCITSAKQDYSGKALEPSQFIAELGDSVTVASAEAFEREADAALHTFFTPTPLKESVFETAWLAKRFAETNLSVTALNNYLDCPIKYLFRNLIQLPDVYTPALRYGNAVHGALEHFFRAAVADNQIPQKDLLLDAYEGAVKRSGFYGSDFETFLRKGRQSLGMYYDYYHTAWSQQVELETYITRDLSLPQVDLTLSGKIDKLEYQTALGSGPVRVVDYKTGKVFSKKTKPQKEALERQIQFYHLLLEDYKKGAVSVAEAVLDFVEPTDDDVFEQKTLSVTQSDLTQLKGTIQAMANHVVDGSFLTAGCQKKDCSYCAFFAAVQAY